MSTYAFEVSSPWTSAAVRHPFVLPAAATSCINWWPYFISLSCRGLRASLMRPTVGICRFRSVPMPLPRS